MKYKIIIFLSVAQLASARPEIPLGGLLSSSDLTQNISAPVVTPKKSINVSGKLSMSDLSHVVLDKPSAKKTVGLSGLLSGSQLDSVIQFMYAKQQKRRAMSGLISSQSLDTSIAAKNKKIKPRMNMIGILLDNYQDPAYQHAMGILHNPKLQQEYDADLKNIQTYFKQYYISPTASEKKRVITLPKVCCADQGQSYSLCQTEQ